MTDTSTFTLVNPQTGNLAFRVFSFNNKSHFDHIQRLNYYSLIWIKNGHGNVKADFLGLDRDINGVENGNILPLAEKWVITLLT